MGLYNHAGRLNVRYYDKDGKYLDHGRMIYQSIPAPGEVIHPFTTTKGSVSWKVIDVKMPENDPCFEFYVECLEF